MLLFLTLLWSATGSSVPTVGECEMFSNGTKTCAATINYVCVVHSTDLQNAQAIRETLNNRCEFEKAWCETGEWKLLQEDMGSASSAFDDCTDLDNLACTAGGECTVDTDCCGDMFCTASTCSCRGALTLCEGKCVNTREHRVYCGSCNKVAECDVGQRCSNSRCIVDTAIDNCIPLGQTCEVSDFCCGDDVCENGVCGCTDDRELCDLREQGATDPAWACLKVSNNVDHCGACGVQCDITTQVCSRGRCVNNDCMTSPGAACGVDPECCSGYCRSDKRCQCHDPSDNLCQQPDNTWICIDNSDDDNCGACGRSCEGNERCFDGVCQAYCVQETETCSSQTDAIPCCAGQCRDNLCVSNVTVIPEYISYWSFVLGADQGGVYFTSSDVTSNNSQPWDFSQLFYKNVDALDATKCTDRVREDRCDPPCVWSDSRCQFGDQLCGSFDNDDNCTTAAGTWCEWTPQSGCVPLTCELLTSKHPCETKLNCAWRPGKGCFTVCQASGTEEDCLSRFADGCEWDVDECAAANCTVYNVTECGGIPGCFWTKDRGCSAMPEMRPEGVTSICYRDKFDVFMVGGQNFMTGDWGPGYVVIGNTSSWEIVYRHDAYALTDTACKGFGVATAELTPYVAVGRYNTIVYSPDGRRWYEVPDQHKPTDYPQDFHLLSVECVNEDICFAMGIWELGITWETHIIWSEDGGRTWTRRFVIQRERGVTMSCVQGTTTCYVTTEIYTGSMIHKTDDLGEHFFPVNEWDVLSYVKIFCYWADECIAGAGSWLGRWHFPAQIRMTRDGGYTWTTLYRGEIGEFIYDCKCGSVNYALCTCSSDNRLLLFDMENEAEVSNITFSRYVGPIGEFQSYFAADILSSLYWATKGPSWLRKTNWLTGNPCTDDWYGVTCDGVDGAATDVIELRLNGNGLDGTIPATLGVLTRLRTLALQVNKLSKTIPASFGRMTELERMTLFNNYFTGTLTSKITFMTSLEHVAIFNNNFFGVLPTDIGNLQNLKYLYLYNNKFQGNLPSSIGQLSDLVWLGLHNNEFSGTLPREIGALTGLKALDLSKNFFTGVIPAEWGQLVDLTHFSVESNRLRHYREPLGPSYSHILNPQDKDPTCPLNSETRSRSCPK